MRDISIVLNAVNVVMRLIEEEKERRDVKGLEKMLKSYVERQVGMSIDTSKKREEIIESISSLHLNLHQKVP